MSKHTPGPWRLDSAMHAHVVDDEYHAIDAGFNGDGFSLLGFMSIADARLIAAAPELLETLREFLLYFTSGNDVPVERATIKADSVLVAKARAAIAKAEGKA